MSFQRVAGLSDLWKGEMRGYEVDGERILLVRLDEGVCAYEDRCAHLGVLLSGGCLDHHTLTCSAHHWQYDVRTGEGLNPRGVRLKSFPLRIQDNDILIDVEGERKLDG